MFDKTEWQRQYRMTAKGKAVVAADNANAQLRKLKHGRSDKGRECHRRYHQTDRGRANLRYHRFKDPLKYKARTALNNAVRDGRIVKLPCRVCGNPKSQGHHKDYNKPLEVDWLCRKHHSHEHHPDVPLELPRTPNEGHAAA